MEYPFQLIYGVLFWVNIALLVLCCCRPRIILWALLYLYEFAGMIISAMIAHYYDSLPGYGIMPGLSYVQETYANMLAAMGFFAMLFVTLVAMLAVLCRTNKSDP